MSEPATQNQEEIRELQGVEDVPHVVTPTDAEGADDPDEFDGLEDEGYYGPYDAEVHGPLAAFQRPSRDQFTEVTK